MKKKIKNLYLPLNNLKTKEKISLKTNKLLNSKHCGFAVTFEVLCTITMMFTFLFLILFVMMVMNGQRYMNTVLTSTASEAARWGGVNSNAYSVNVGGTKLMDSAQSQLDQVVREFNAKISGSPNKIQSDGEPITIKINYHIPPFWSGIGKVSNINSSNSVNMYSKLENSGAGLSMQITVRSIMKAGKLL